MGGLICALFGHTKIDGFNKNALYADFNFRIGSYDRLGQTLRIYACRRCHQLWYLNHKEIDRPIEGRTEY